MTVANLPVRSVHAGGPAAARRPDLPTVRLPLSTTRRLAFASEASRADRAVSGLRLACQWAQAHWQFSLSRGASTAAQ